MSQTADSSNGKSHGLDTATYYGAIALAVFIVAAVTIVSRILYTRRRAYLARVSETANRETFRPVYNENHDGLPTYRESQLVTMVSHRNPAVDYPPPPPPPAAHSNNGNENSTFTGRLASKLRIKNLSKIIPHRRSDSNSVEPVRVTEPRPSSDAPPKYDEVLPLQNHSLHANSAAVQSSSHSTHPDDTSTHPPVDHISNLPTIITSSPTEPSPQSHPSTPINISSQSLFNNTDAPPVEEEFIHPEERRRNDAAQNSQS